MMINNTDGTYMSVSIGYQCDVHDVSHFLPCRHQLVDDEVPAVWTQRLIVQLYRNLGGCSVLLAVGLGITRSSRLLFINDN